MARSKCVVVWSFCEGGGVTDLKVLDAVGRVEIVRDGAPVL